VYKNLLSSAVGHIQGVGLRSSLCHAGGALADTAQNRPLTFQIAAQAPVAILNARTASCENPTANWASVSRRSRSSSSNSTSIEGTVLANINHEQPVFTPDVKTEN